MLESLAIIYENLSWPVKSARALRTILGEATRYWGLTAVLTARESGVAAGLFSDWTRRNPTAPVTLVSWSIERIVSAYLKLSEMARAGYNPQQADGDESITPSSFGIALYEVDETNPDYQKPVSDPTIAAEALAALAYAQNGVLGDGEVEMRHVWLLEELGKRALGRKQYEAAWDYLQRGLKVAEGLNDSTFRLSILNNLAVAFHQNSDLAGEMKYLESAANVANSYLSEATFPVDVIMEHSGPDGRSIVVERRRVDPQEKDEDSGDADANTRWIRRAHIPVNCSRAFDENSEKVLNRTFAEHWAMMAVIASVFANAGHRALAEDEASALTKIDPVALV